MRRVFGNTRRSSVASVASTSRTNIEPQSSKTQQIKKWTIGPIQRVIEYARSHLATMRPRVWRADEPNDAAEAEQSENVHSSDLTVDLSNDRTRCDTGEYTTDLSFKAEREWSDEGSSDYENDDFEEKPLYQRSVSRPLVGEESGETSESRDTSPREWLAADGLQMEGGSENTTPMSVVRRQANKIKLLTDRNEDGFMRDMRRWQKQKANAGESNKDNSKVSDPLSPRKQAALQMPSINEEKLRLSSDNVEDVGF